MTCTIYVFFSDSVCFVVEFHLIMINVNIYISDIELSESRVGGFLIFIYGLTDMAKFCNILLRIRQTTLLLIHYIWFSYRFFTHRQDWVLHTVLHWMAKWSHTALVNIVITFKLLWLKPADDQHDNHFTLSISCTVSHVRLEPFKLKNGDAPGKTPTLNKILGQWWPLYRKQKYKEHISILFYAITL
jgi:hypothetical protein